MRTIPDYEAAARKAAKRHGVDPDVFVAMLRQESGLKPGLTSTAGAQGIAQFMPATARAYGVNLTDGRVGDDLEGAARYMADNLKRTGGDIRAALSIYNSGRPDAYKDPGFAHGQTYNYVRSILAGVKVKAPKATTPRVKVPGTVAPGAPAPQAYSTRTVTTPATDNSGLRRQLIGEFLQHGGVGNSGAVLALAGAYGQAGDIPGTSTTTRTAIPTAPSPRAPARPSRGVVPLGGSKNRGKGAFTVSGPNPGRLRPGLVSFAKRVARIYGGTLTGLDGSTHSKYTVNGNVSEHYTGNATDIFTINGKPATGKRLIRAGRAALIAAGMPRAEALRAPGGLYNVGRHQIIFGVSGPQYGGNHLDHLHISTHAGGRSRPSSSTTGASSPAPRAAPRPAAPRPVAPRPAPAPRPAHPSGPVKQRLYAHPDRPGAKYGRAQRRIGH